MAIPDFLPRVEYVGNNIDTEYDFDFKIVSKDQIVIIALDVDLSLLWIVRGDDTTYLAGITINPAKTDGGGTITLEDPLTVGQHLVLMLAADEPTQPKEFRNKATWTLAQIEDALDFQNILIQTLAYKVSRSLRVSDEVLNSMGFDPTVPAPVADAVIGFNSDGTALENKPPGLFIGPQGDQGIAATITLGDVTEVPAGDPPTVTNSGDDEDAVFDFELPGAPTLAIGTVTEIEPDDPTPMSVANSGTAFAAVLDFVLRKGEQGEVGQSTVLVTVSDQLPDNGVGSNGDVWFFIKDADPDNGDFYQKIAGVYTLKGNIQGPPGGVNSFNGRTGTVLPVDGDYIAVEVDFIPTVRLASTDVQAAIEEVDAYAEDLQDQIDNLDLLPPQTGQAGKFLGTNGTVPAWLTVDALPTQTGNAGKILGTNGTIAAWEDKTPALKRVSNVTASGTVGANTDLVSVDASGGNVALTIPAAVVGKVVEYIRIDNTANTVTLDRAGTDQIMTEEGLTNSWTLTAQGKSVRMETYAANRWGVM